MDSNFNSLLFSRHSIRRYKDQPLDPQSVKQIFEAALLSPSSKSARPWQFVAVEDREVLTQLSKCKKIGSVSLKTAQLAIVVCADPAKSDVYVEDCSVAANMMHLQAAALGIGSCWVQIHNRFSEDGEPAQNMVKELLNIPDELQVVVIMTFGISDENRKPVDPSKLLWEKVHIGSYNNSASPEKEQ